MTMAQPNQLCLSAVQWWRFYASLNYSQEFNPLTTEHHHHAYIILSVLSGRMANTLCLLHIPCNVWHVNRWRAYIPCRHHPRHYDLDRSCIMGDIIPWEKTDPESLIRSLIFEHDALQAGIRAMDDALQGLGNEAYDLLILHICILEDKVQQLEGEIGYVARNHPSAYKAALGGEPLRQGES
jgi:hypothetical protein